MYFVTKWQTFLKKNPDCMYDMINQVVNYSSISLMIIAFLFFIICKRNLLDRTKTFIDAIAIALIAREIPNIFLIILSAYCSTYIGQVKDLSSTLTLIGLILLFYVYRMFVDKFKSTDS